MTIKDLQNAINNIDELENASQYNYFLKLIEETGELADVIRKDKKMQDEQIKDSVEEEIVDCLYYLVCLANYYEIDLEHCLKLKEDLNAKKYKRDNMFKQ